MYKTNDKSQQTFLGFNQPLGLHMNPNNKWVKKADQVPWDVFENKYAELFQSNTGNVAKPLQMALGSLIIQTRFGFSDVDLVEQIQENPYFQYFIGLPGYQEEAPFEASSLVHFRKRISYDIIAEANEFMIDPPKASKDDSDNDNIQPPSGGSTDESVSKELTDEKPKNIGTLILDATCSPSNIKYPQDFALLNDAREKLEAIIDRFCLTYGLSKPRMYRKEARTNYLKLAKCKKRSEKKIRKTIRKQLSYVKRDMKYLDRFLSEGYAPTTKEIEIILTIYKLYEQQEYMYKNKIHKVEDRIVSISQPYIRPIVRGKVKAPVEFGAKLDISIVDGGFVRIEKISFDPYNESSCLQDAVDRYYKRNGYYPERVLADQIYRNRVNRDYCNDKGIRLSGPKLGRPTKTVLADKKVEYQDNVDRIEVERAISLAKHRYGLKLIRTKLESTSLTAIALAIFTMNLFKGSARSFFVFCTCFQNQLNKVLMKIVLRTDEYTEYMVIC